MRPRSALRRLGRPASAVAVTVLAATLALAVLLWSPSFAAATPASEPNLASRAAIVVDAATGRVFYRHNEKAELAPASLTKMVTALVAVERAPLDRLVRPMHDYDVTPVLIGIGAGDSLPLRDVLYGLLLNSGNDAALAVAETVGDGSVDRFVGWMNEAAQRLGLEHTRFRNPHGLDQDGHVSSAYDMAVIGRAVMRNPTLSRIVGEQRHEVTGPPRWVFTSTNPLIGRYAGIDGIKTGFDDLAGRCFVATAMRDGRRAVAVVMNSDRYADDAAALLDFAFADEGWAPQRRPARDSASVRVASLRADLDRAADDAPATLAAAVAQVGAARSGPPREARP